MKFNLKLKNFISLILIITFLKGSFFVSSEHSRSKDEDFKNKYGVQLVYCEY